MTSILDLINSNTEGKVEFIPFVQVARGTNANPVNFGLFISLTEAEKVRFQLGGGWKKHTYQTQSASIEGYINPNPAFVIIKQGRLGIFDRATKQFLTYFNKYENSYDKTKHELRTRYLVLFVEGKKPLHTSPLQLTAKGAFGASMGETLKGFKDNFGKVIGGTRRGDFWNRVVFQPELKPKEMKINPANSTWVTSAAGCVFPTADNIADIYLDEELGDKEVLELIKGWKEEYKEFGQFSNASKKEMEDYTEAETKPSTSSEGRSLLERIRAKVEEAPSVDTDTSDIPY